VQSFFFPDNTVFVNFAWVDRLALLRAYLGERGRLVEAVAHEIGKSSNHVPHLGTVDISAWFEVVVEFDDDAAQGAIESIRRHRFGGNENQPLKHLGESQTIYAITKIEEFRSSVCVTDDQAAYLLAKSLGCVVEDTVGVLRRLCANQEISSQDAFEIAVAIQNASPDGRKLITPFSSARDFA
jgi:predicted nucleic acid-binding protein